MPDLESVLLGCAIFYLILLCADLFRANRAFASYFGGAASQRRPKPFFYLTSAGAFLKAFCESAFHKINSLSRQIEVHNAEIVSKIGTGENRSGFEHLVKSVFPNLRADRAVIMTYNPDDCSIRIDLNITPSGESQYKKLEAHLTKFYQTYFTRGAQDIIGLRDGYQSASLTGDFCIFGYRYAMATEFEYENHLGTIIKGLFWTGYSTNPPYDHDIEFAKSFCRRLSTEAVSQRIIYDLSSKVNEEKVLNKQANEFIAHASHDIRAPLNNIRSILNLMQLNEKDKENQEILEVAIGNCSDMEEIVNAILDFSRFQAGQLVPKKELVDLEFLLNEVINNHRFNAKLRGLAINLEATDKLVADIDRRQVKRIFNNLVTNAIKYTREGGIDITLRAAADGRCSIVVSDTGIGMNPEQLGLLFTPFSRFHHAEAEGIGLGLTLTKILVELNGGEIKVQSAVKKGSRFEVLFPCQSRLEETGRNGSMERQRGDRDLHLPRVLIVDDDPLAVESLGNFLIREGYLVTKCHTVSDAIGLINFSVPDFLLTDWSMPGGGARRLLSYIKESNIAIESCVISGSDEPHLYNEVTALGARRLQPKNGNHREILEWINSLMQPAEMMVA